MYSQLDFGEGCDYVRKLKDFGYLDGFDKLFSYLVYDGYGKKFREVVNKDNFSPYWKQACEALNFIHEKGKKFLIQI